MRWKRPTALALALAVALVVGWHLLPATAPEEPAFPPAETTPVPESATTAEESAEASAEERITALAQDAATGREPQPLAACRGRVVDESGDGVPAASVEWVELSRIHQEWEPSWHRDEWGELPLARTRTTTDDAGWFEFTADRAPGDGATTLLWAVHAGYRPETRVLDGEALASPVVLTLTRTPTVTIRVESGTGAPIAGATVDWFALSPAFGDPDSPGVEAEGRARRTFHRRLLTDASGHASFAPLTGEQVLVASSGALRSRPWRGTPTGAVVLRLEDTFEVSGRILLPDWTHLDYVGERRLQLAAVRGGIRTVLATLRDVQAGEWGPVRLPLFDAVRYEVRLEGSPIIPVLYDFAPPDAGGTVRVDLQAELGLDLWILAKTRAGDVIHDSVATAFWEEDGQLNRAHRHARPDGYIDVWSMPPGDVFVSIEAPGYQSQVSIPVALPADGYLEFELSPAGTLLGTCTYLDEPVEDFRVVAWSTRLPGERAAETFHDRADGTFELTSIGLGEYFVVAMSDTHPPSGRKRITVGADGPATVDLELPALASARGVVLDAAGEPVGAAEVQLLVPGMSLLPVPFGYPIPVEPDGSFELTHLAVGENRLAFRAPGHSEVRRTVLGRTDLPADLGRIVLASPQDLEVRLVTAGEEVDFTTWSCGGGTEVTLPTKPFSHEGVVRYEGVSPGVLAFHLNPPGVVNWMELILDLRPGRPWRYTHRVSGPKHLTIEVVPREGGTIADTPAIYLHYTSSEGVRVRWGIEVPPSGVVALEGIDADTVGVDVTNTDFEKAVTRQVAFEGEDSFHLTIPIGDESFALQVVDPDGAPVPNALVEVHDTFASPLEIWGRTDDEGRLVVGIPERRVALTVHHPVLGSVAGMPLDGAAGHARVVLRKDASLRLRVVDGTLPLADVEAQFVSAGGQPLLVPATSRLDGAVRWEGLTSGTYRVRARHPDCWPVVVEAAAAAGPEVHEVQMRRLGSLALEVVTEEGLPVAGQTVALHSLELEETVADWLEAGRVEGSGLTTDRAGRVDVWGIPHGSYRWTVGGRSGVVVVLPGDTVQERVVLAD
jgi:hypothetical protein